MKKFMLICALTLPCGMLIAQGEPSQEQKLVALERKVSAAMIDEIVLAGVIVCLLYKVYTMHCALREAQRAVPLANQPLSQKQQPIEAPVAQGQQSIAGVVDQQKVALESAPAPLKEALKSKASVEKLLRL